MPKDYETLGIHFNKKKRPDDKRMAQAFLDNLAYKTGRTRPQIILEALQDLNLKYDERGNRV